MARDALRKIVAAAASTSRVKPVFANHAYFRYCEEKDWGGISPPFIPRKKKSNKKIKKR